MVEPVEVDARGIVNPDVGLRHFRLDRRPPSAGLVPWVDRYWVARWNLAPGTRYTQRVLSHPAVNVVITEAGAAIHGVQRRPTDRELSGQGWAVGIMFRPAGFHPFVDRPLTALADRSVALDQLVAPAMVRDLVTAMAAAPDVEDRTAIADRFVADLPRRASPRSEELSGLIERAAGDPCTTRADALAAELGISPRQLQRRFAELVGVSPKWVIRRYRLYDVAEQAARGDDVRWADVAASLGYSDQAHLVRDFTAAFGVPPGRYAQACRDGVAPTVA